MIDKSVDLLKDFMLI